MWTAVRGDPGAAGIVKGPGCQLDRVHGGPTGRSGARSGNTAASTAPVLAAPRAVLQPRDPAVRTSASCGRARSQNAGSSGERIENGSHPSTPGGIHELLPAAAAVGLASAT